MWSYEGPPGQRNGVQSFLWSVYAQIVCSRLTTRGVSGWGCQWLTLRFPLCGERNAPDCWEEDRVRPVGSGRTRLVIKLTNGPLRSPARLAKKLAAFNQFSNE